MTTPSQKMPRIPYVARRPYPELEEFLATFEVHFRDRRGRRTIRQYLSGLLTEHPNKNCDTLAQVVPDTTEQRLQALLTELDWDEEDLNRQRVEKMRGLSREGDGVLILDDTGFGKKGDCSVGVARQYSGTLGKVGNCQVTVNCHYAERTLAWPVSTRLYLPKAWAEDPPRRRKAHVPEEISFQTKAEIALALLDQARGWGVRHACVTADADYGKNPGFLDGLEDRREHYVVEIPADFSVATTRGGPIERVDALVAQEKDRLWRTISWRMGSQGWLRARFLAGRMWRVDGKDQRRFGWLIAERPPRGQTGKSRYYWSNFGPQTLLERMVEYARRRHWIEQYHEEAKELLGWDQYQGRLWTGFHRHAVTVMLAYSFLVWQEWRERSEVRRPGPPRRPFSPSARSASQVPGRRASPHRRLATPGGGSRTDVQRTH